MGGRLRQTQAMARARVSEEKRRRALPPGAGESAFLPQRVTGQSTVRSLRWPRTSRQRQRQSTDMHATADLPRHADIPSLTTAKRLLDKPAAGLTDADFDRRHRSGNCAVAAFNLNCYKVILTRLLDNVYRS